MTAAIATYLSKKGFAEAGVPEAQVVMGDMHAIGRRAAFDPAQARNWYERAAAAGHDGALERLRRLALAPARGARS